MKRLIVISVIFALVAGAAFAEVNVGGAVMGKINVLEGSSEKHWEGKFVEGDPEATFGDAKGKGINASGGISRLRIEGSGQSDDGTFGGYVRFEAGSDQGGVSGFGNAWWQPIDQVKFLIGSVGYDGFFGKDGVARWGFYRDGNEVGITQENWLYGASFYEGFRRGGILTIKPLEALEINIGVPFFEGGRAEKVFKNTEAQVAFNIDGIGTVAVTYVGAYEGDNGWDAPDKVLRRSSKVNYYDAIDKKNKDLPELGNLVPYADPSGFVYIPASYVGDTYDIGIIGSNGRPKFFAYFDLAAIENLGVQLGVGFTLPSKDELDGYYEDLNGDEDPTLGKWTETHKYNTPLAVGLGLSFDAGAFGIKFRAQGQFAEKYTHERKDNYTGATPQSEERTLKGPFVLNADILPSFAINDTMKIYLSAGLSLKGKYNVTGFVDNPAYDNSPGAINAGISPALEKEIEQDSVVGWHIQPYFSKSVGWCQGFYAGFRLESNGAKNTDWNKATAVSKRGEGKSIINWSVPIGIAFQF